MPASSSSHINDAVSRGSIGAHSSLTSRCESGSSGFITSGALAEYLDLDGETLTRFKLRTEELFDGYAEKFALIEAYMADGIIDGGSPLTGKETHG